MYYPVIGDTVFHQLTNEKGYTIAKIKQIGTKIYYNFIEYPDHDCNADYYFHPNNKKKITLEEFLAD